MEIEEIPRKKTRLETVQNMQNTGSICLTSLYDFCILKFFEYLELNELVAVGKTCKKLQRLVEGFFNRNYGNKIMSEVRIELTFYREIRLSPEEQFVTSFLKHMRNVRLGEGFIKRPLDMVEYMRNNCSDNFRAMSFERIKFHELHGALLIDWLLTVEGLSFFGCENLHQILEYCSNLKYLKIDQYSKDRSEQNQWMEQRYPTLEHLQYDVIPNHKLLTFLTNNPNVKSLMLKLDNKRTLGYTPQLFHELRDVNLEEFMVTFDEIGETKMVGDPLKAICSGSNFKRLELCFNDTGCNGWNRNPNSKFAHLKELNNLIGLHILRCDREFPSDIILEHLKVLQLAEVPDDISIVDLSKNLPNLEELYLITLSMFQDLVTPFARNAVQLKKIVARDFKIPNRMEMTNARLAKHFNDEREQLSNACKLMIYIGKDVYDDSFDRTTPNFPLVQIRRVEFHLKEVPSFNPYLSNFEF